MDPNKEKDHHALKTWPDLRSLRTLSLQLLKGDFSKIFKERMRDNGQKPKCRKFHLNVRKKSLAVNVV